LGFRDIELGVPQIPGLGYFRLYWNIWYHMQPYIARTQKQIRYKDFKPSLEYWTSQSFIGTSNTWFLKGKLDRDQQTLICDVKMVTKNGKGK